VERFAMSAETFFGMSPKSGNTIINADFFELIGS